MPPPLKPPPASPVPPPAQAQPLRRLHNFNVGLAVLFWAVTLLAVVGFLLAYSDAQCVPVTTHRLEIVQERQPDGGTRRVRRVRVQQVARVWAPAMVIGFLGYTATAHTLYAADPRGAYSTAVGTLGRNPFRWLEYSVSATIMALAVYLLSGVSDAGTLGLLTAAIPALQLAGDAAERALNAPVTATPSPAGPVVGAPTASGWLTLSAMVAVLVPTFMQRLADARAGGSAVPQWVTWVVVPTVVFFSIFGLPQAWSGAVRAWTGAPPGVAAFSSRLRVGRLSLPGAEPSYMTLSAVAKLFLAAWVGVGMVQSANGQREDEDRDKGKGEAGAEDMKSDSRGAEALRAK